MKPKRNHQEMIKLIKEKYGNFREYSYIENTNIYITNTRGYFSGWYNNVFNGLTFQLNVLNKHNLTILNDIEELYRENGWEISYILNGVSFQTYYNELSKEEQERKSYQSLINGGRMSD